MNQYVRGWNPQDAAEAATLSADLDQLVAAGQLREADAAQILPGYGYPELLLWIHPPLDELNPPPLADVRARGLHLQNHRAINQAIARHQHWHDVDHFDQGQAFDSAAADDAAGA